MGGGINHADGPREAARWPGLDDRARTRQIFGDVAKETAALGKKLREIKDRRSRYQEMAVAGFIEFEELRESLAGIEDQRQDTERALEATRTARSTWSG